MRVLFGIVCGWLRRLPLIVWFISLTVRLRRTSSGLLEVLTELFGTEEAKPFVTDVFISHDWGTDTIGRDTHARVRALNKRLQASGLHTWFDEEKLVGDSSIYQQMAEGIDGSATVLVCVTRNYMRKVTSRDPLDACRHELSYAAMHKGTSRLIVAVMEPECADPKAWSGLLGFVLGDKLYTDLSTDVHSDVFDAGAEKIVREVRHAKCAAEERARKEAEDKRNRAAA